MSLVPVDLQSIAERIHATGESEIITPRTLAGYFNAQRRTSYTVWRIRRALEEVKLVTHPSFEIVYMDTTVELRPLPEIAPATSDSPLPEQVESESVTHLVIGGSFLDPVPRIAMLQAANRLPVTVNR